jgi:hypothetical protein
MKRKKITQRDPFGRELSSYEEEQDDGSGPLDSRTGLLKDGKSIRVSMMMRDAVPQPNPGALVMYDVPPQRDALVINANSPPMVVDAFGSTEGLNCPGARYLVAGHRTTDHARLVTLAVMRDDAYKTYDEEAQNAWRGETGTTDPSVADRKPDAMPVIDAVEQAYAEYDKEMAEAWRIGK